MSKLYATVQLVGGPADGLRTHVDTAQETIILEYYPPCEGYASVSHPDSAPAPRRPTRLVYTREYVEVDGADRVHYAYKGLPNG